MIMTEKNYGTSGTTVLTEDVIAEAVAEAEAGYALSRLRRRGRPTLGATAGVGVHLRLEPDLHRALKAAAKDAHVTLSEVIRRALRDHLRAS